MPRYELVEGTSSKFWEIEISGSRVTTRWGRIGTAGQEKSKDFASPEKAQAEHDALIREKTGKGYQEADAASAPAAPRPAPAPQPAPEVAPSPPPVAAASAAPPRPVFSDPAMAWARMRERFAGHAEAWKSSRSLDDPDLAPVLRRVLKKLESAGDGLPPAADPETEGALLVMLTVDDSWNEIKLDDEIVTVWAAIAGLPFVVEALQASFGFQAAHADVFHELWLTRKNQGGGVAAHRPSGFRHWWHLRRRLAVADPAEYAATRATAQRLRAEAPLNWRVPLTYLFPETEWVEEDAGEALLKGSRWKSSLLLPVVRNAGLATELITRGDYGWASTPCGMREDALGDLARSLAGNLGASAVGPLVQLLDRANDRPKILEALVSLATPEVVEALADRVKHRETAAALTSFAARHPRVVLPVLAARSGRSEPGIASLLAQMVRREPDLARELLPGLPHPAQRAIEALLAKADLPPDAVPADLPPVLASPPWQRKGGRKEAPAVLDLPPLPEEETIHWPSGERERWLRENPMNPWLASRSEPERIEMLLRNMGVRNPGSWRKLDEASLRQRAVEEGLAPASKASSSNLALLPTRIAFPLWEALPASAWGPSDPPWRFVAEQEIRVLPGLLRFATVQLATAVQVFLPFRSPRLAPFAAEALVRLKTVRPAARRWLLAHDEAAALGLIPAAVGPAGKPREAAGVALRFVAAHGRQELILEVAGRWGAEVREAVRSVLEADPLDLFPARLPKLPAWWQPEGLARPLLRGRSAALPLPAVEALGTMLAFSSLEEPYAGLDQVRQACDSGSLAAFAWDLFSAWLAAGAPAKEAWALQALGHFGDDSCARRLAALVREWPGEAAHARAVAGLDILRAIGTDVALMHLHGISQKVKFKGLQDKAREKIEEIAEQRGLTPEDLEDRLVPDLGLGADGSLLLDVGPRSFRVGFDEALKPFVRGANGKRLPDLPKPGKSDDAEKARQAQDVWKALKKDARAVAAHQILRLELAMCGRRRWEPDVFRSFFLDHPLLLHLVRRLVWGAWDAEGRLTGMFRVSEDGSLADAADDAWELPDGVRVGIVHRLDLSEEQAARWGEIFSDYEILQPFAQIGREVRAITEEERAARELRRVEGVTVPTGKVLGLVDRRGWRRGPAQDAGLIWWFSKPLPGGEHEACLALDPGIAVGAVMEFPEQKLGTVTIERSGSWDPQGNVAFGKLDPIVFSELVRDLESLRE